MTCDCRNAAMTKTLIALAKVGGLQTRGILLDIPSYLEAKRLSPLDPLSYPSNIPVDLELFKSVLAFQNLTVQPGDVVLVRLGFESVMKEDQARVATGEQSRLPKRSAGIKAAWDMMEWIWESGIVAIATDNGSFEDFCECSSIAKASSGAHGSFRRLRGGPASSSGAPIGHGRHDRGAVCAQRSC